MSKVASIRLTGDAETVVQLVNALNAAQVAGVRFQISDPSPPHQGDAASAAAALIRQHSRLIVEAVKVGDSLPEGSHERRVMGQLVGLIDKLQRTLPEGEEL